MRKQFPGVKNSYECSGLIHTCHTCGKKSTWENSWSWFYLCHGKGYSGWEEEIKSCCDDCAQKARIKYAKKRK